MSIGIIFHFSLTENVMVDNLTLEDAQEGINAFFEKRPPVWPKDEWEILLYEILYENI